MRSQASADAMVVSQSFARQRQRPNHAKLRSTTQRRAMTTKAFLPGACVQPAEERPEIVVDLVRGGRVSIFADAPPVLATAVLKALR